MKLFLVPILLLLISCATTKLPVVIMCDDESNELYSKSDDAQAVAKAANELASNEPTQQNKDAAAAANIAAANIAVDAAGSMVNEVLDATDAEQNGKTVRIIGCGGS